MGKKILAINPGSTSTKVGLFGNETELFSRSVSHSAAELAHFTSVSDQLPYRRDSILAMLEEEGLSPAECAAFAGRGGGLQACAGGVYEVNDRMLEHARSGKYGGNHPAALGCQLAHEFADLYGGRAFVVNPPDTDEFCDEARVTGLKGVYRASHIHALNQKETALRVAADLGLEYRRANFIVAHIGGGVSVTAHRQGKMVDSNDIVGGDGPMMPTRIGSVPVKALMQAGIDSDEMEKLLTRSGGFIDHLGTADMLEVKKRIDTGDRYADLIYRAFIYQIAKEIGAMAAVLSGKVDAVILTGGIVRDTELVSRLQSQISFIAPVEVRPGEFELEALALGALRVLNGTETALLYTGEPPFNGFQFE